MKYGSLIIEKKEYVFLKRILNISGYAQDFEVQKSLQRLSDELKVAQIIDNEEMPQDVIRFDSKVTIVSDNAWHKTFQLVTPNDADSKNDKISILTPMGSALFGYAQGDIIEWEFPTGKKKLTVKEVKQEHTNHQFEVLI